jgi:outer membrane protein OmpA-like peptidoglycan-associated protein
MRQTTIAGLLVIVSLGGCATVTEGVNRVTGRSAAVTAPVCQDFTFPLYFRTGSEQLTPEGLQVIDNYSARVRACPVAALNVTGLADAEGGAVANLQLSQRRAASVAQVLSARGYPTPTFDVAAQGAAGATTAAGRTEPLRRRAEVSVRFATPQPAS